MQAYRYTILLQQGEILVDIAKFRSIDEATLFLKVVSKEYPMYDFSIDDTYKNLTLAEIVAEETELQEL